MSFRIRLPKTVSTKITTCEGRRSDHLTADHREYFQRPASCCVHARAPAARVRRLPALHLADISVASRRPDLGRETALSNEPHGTRHSGQRKASFREVRRVRVRYRAFRAGQAACTLRKEKKYKAGRAAVFWLAWSKNIISDAEETVNSVLSRIQRNVMMELVFD